MPTDYLLHFSDVQALTATAVSTNILDLSSQRNIGVGEPMALVVLVAAAADGTTGDETYSVALQVDDNAAFSSPVTIGTVVITRGDVAGTRYVLGIPVAKNFERYARLNYTLGGTTPIVSVTAYLTQQNMLQTDNAYPSGFTIS